METIKFKTNKRQIIFHLFKIKKKKNKKLNKFFQLNQMKLRMRKI